MITLDLSNYYFMTLFLIPLVKGIKTNGQLREIFFPFLPSLQITKMTLIPSKSGGTNGKKIYFRVDRPFD
jgi:hypothetical protein